MTCVIAILTLLAGLLALLGEHNDPLTSTSETFNQGHFPELGNGSFCSGCGALQVGGNSVVAFEKLEAVVDDAVDVCEEDFLDCGESIVFPNFSRYPKAVVVSFCAHDNLIFEVEIF